jgi:hypothetical protein
MRTIESTKELTIRVTFFDDKQEEADLFDRVNPAFFFIKCKPCKN